MRELNIRRVYNKLSEEKGIPYVRIEDVRLALGGSRTKFEMLIAILIEKNMVVLGAGEASFYKEEEGFRWGTEVYFNMRVKD
jgi:hypothetical protein